ncbi:hypothetical protein DY000_02059280 [Brassica cretica]|uniref:Uncharacterized protein n=1 Tax=Brassica cretica TaxID=69181 RepID=A0ABQ7AS91_BRACR|nr:hypothetical protein DY000_02059280 [Brassica cretica]
MVSTNRFTVAGSRTTRSAHFLRTVKSPLGVQPPLCLDESYGFQYGNIGVHFLSIAPPPPPRLASSLHSLPRSAATPPLASLVRRISPPIQLVD